MSIGKYWRPERRGQQRQSCRVSERRTTAALSCPPWTAPSMSLDFSCPRHMRLGKRTKGDPGHHYGGREHLQGITVQGQLEAAECEQSHTLILPACQHPVLSWARPRGWPARHRNIKQTELQHLHGSHLHHTNCKESGSSLHRHLGALEFWLH